MYSNAANGAQGLSPDVPTIQAFFANHGSGIHVCAMLQDSDGWTGRHFADDVAGATEYAASLTAMRHNVYYQYNEPLPNCGHKASKRQIDSLWGTHVDIDPPKDGSPFDKDAKLHDVQHHGPTIVINSGNGLQACWLFPHPIPATPENVELVEGVNRALIAKFGGDAGTWNVDRVLRVPGTINWPNAEKRKLGRVPCMATVLL